MNKFAAPLAVLATLTSISQANALSCAREGFDLEATFNKHAASSEKIMFITGRFSGGPARSGTFGGKSTKTTLNFTGAAIGKNSLPKLSSSVEVHSQCLASWCGPLPPNGVETIAAVKVTGSGKLVLNSGPCSPNQFQNDVKNGVALIQKCMKNGKCQ